ncbi:MAG: YicC family protein [Oscillospiraceae bacterium]|nr:YicC family protein [Oscillospiraceae bacterium]
MINSMTGFGRAEETDGGRDILVEVKSVNHRFFDFNARISRGYGFLEEKLKTALKSRVSRGKIDVLVAVEPADGEDVTVQVNHSLVSGYLDALYEIQRRYNLPDDISVDTVARFPDVFTIRRAPEDEDALWEEVRRVLEKAMDPFLAMRAAEGAHMKEDVLGRANTILKLVSGIEERSPQTVEEYRNKLKERISGVLEGAAVDEGRILTEAAVFADKVSVDEETVRLRSHVSQFSDMLESGGPVGRRLDFLVQEMNREANTIGSKCADAGIAHMVVDLKAEIEKIREQIQNIE